MAPGFKFSHYTVLELIGSGKMGVVFAAFDSKLERKVAIKVLQPGGEDGSEREKRERLLIDEAKKLAKVEHPNVISVYDTGSFGQGVFLAMEYAGGGTLLEWLRAKPRSWNEILSKFLEAGRGLAAAHREDVVHSDFKPANVLLDRDGRARVVDFGLARKIGDGPVAQMSPQLGPAMPADPSTALQVLSSISRTGALVGTPAYMAPEQFLGNKPGPRSDQFSFCVALFEALYGVRPFDGHDLLSIGSNVVLGNLRSPPQGSDVPPWIHRILRRGLAVRPEDRYPSLSALLDELAADPMVQRRRGGMIAATAAAIVTTVVIAWQLVEAKHREVERNVADHLADAAALRSQAAGHDQEAGKLRARAFESFAARRKEEGERLWQSSLVETNRSVESYQRATQRLEAALGLKPAASVRRLLGDVLVERASSAERDHRLEERDKLLAALARLDSAAVEAWQVPAVLTIENLVGATRFTVEQFVPGAEGRFRLKPIREGAPGRLEQLTLPAGSYLLTFTAQGRAEGRHPIVLGRGERARLRVELPDAGSVPAGFVFVPAGRFLFGSGDESLRTEFLGTTPLRPAETPAFLIAKHETTYAEYIAFLESLPPSVRRERAPRTGSPLWGQLELRRVDGRGWRLTLRPTKHRLQAVAGEPIIYPERRRRTQQEWMRFPVGGVSAADARAYAAWLSESRRVPGARLCTELEWERAARGADDREFPHGVALSADDANFDQTYGRRSGAFGPDEVGAHPASRSPFGVDDMAGNLMEIVESSLATDEIVLRGGGYYYTARSARSTNRYPVEPTTRSIDAGIRICADAPRSAASTGGAR